jgi:type IV pilus assembly protein PilC
MRQTENGRLKQAEWSIFRSPLRRIHSMNAAAQFASTMATMLTAGLPIVQALEVTSNVVSNYAVGRAIRSVRQGVEQGKSMVECMSNNKCFPKMLSEMTGVGERSGNLEETLNVISDYFNNEVSVTTERLLSILEPVITIVLAVVTVVLLLSVYLPMFTMYSSI